MIVSKKLGNGITVHGIQTGTVAVTKEHFEYSGWGLLRIPKILFGKTFMPEMPIWTWCIETPEGTFLIDTGESTDFYNADHFKQKGEDFVNRRILRIKVSAQQHIDQQLLQIGLSPDKIDAIIMTHMHLDHTDGLRFFPNTEIFISKKDWEMPYGIALSTFPSSI